MPTSETVKPEYWDVNHESPSVKWKMSVDNPLEKKGKQISVKFETKQRRELFSYF